MILENFGHYELLSVSFYIDIPALYLNSFCLHICLGLVFFLNVSFCILVCVHFWMYQPFLLIVSENQIDIL